MRGPAGMRTLFNESLRKEIRKKHLCQPNDIAGQLCWTKEDPPSLKPVFARGRTPEPHGKSVADAEGREHTSAGIRHKRCIIVLQSIAADKDKHQQGAGHHQSPDCRVGYVTAGSALRTELASKFLLTSSTRKYIAYDKNIRACDC